MSGSGSPGGSGSFWSNHKGLSILAVVAILGAMAGWLSYFGDEAERAESTKLKNERTKAVVSPATSPARDPILQKKACEDLQGTLEVLAEALTEAKNKVIASETQQPTRLDLGFAGTAQKARDAADALGVAYDAYLRSRLPAVKTLEVVDEISGIRSILDDLQQEVPEGKGDPDDYTALPDRANKFRSLADGEVAERCRNL
jgi:hypothetical protein